MSAVAIRSKVRQRVLIADPDLLFARRLADYLWDHGYEARAVQSIAEARANVRDWRPHSVFMSLSFPEGGAISIMRFINSDSIRTKPKVSVMTKPGHMRSSLEEVLREGGKHALIKPFALEEVLRIVGGEKDKQEVVVTAAEPEPELPQAKTKVQIPPTEGDPVKELHLLNLILKQAMQNNQGRLFNLLRMINLKVNAVRSSLIECLDERTAVVVASNDDENIGGHRIHLVKYPEVQSVRKTGKPLIIPNIRTSDLLAPVRESLTQIPWETMVIFPVIRDGRFYGVLSLRMEQKDPVEMYYIEKFGQVCAHILALSIKHPDLSIFRE